ncbi:hypothetical protein [Nonomuraea lactucae]|uniref:hypothetical protein n=1 Tax=Nonomuraea lactucae TaxID=2249762 RepID=UPI000DE1C6A2|nr:hypothetical protein [Nonomuraea lactucae]
MTIIADQQQIDPHAIRYAVHIWRGAAKISSTEPTTGQAEARDMFRALTVSFPDSVLVVQGTDGEWRPASDEMLDRLATHRAALALADIVIKGPDGINWSLRAHSPGEVDGHTFSRERVEEVANFLGVDVTERVNGEHLTVRAEGTYRGVPVEVYCVTRIEQAKCVECGAREGLAQQRDHRTDTLVWLCADCHHEATADGA